MNTKRRIVIAGAGVAGLAIAYRLALSGREVFVAEKESTVGGLARSFVYDDYTFDIGPHRFHTEDPDVVRFIHDILQDDYSLIERRSGVWMFGKYYDWPLTVKGVLRMPPSVLRSVAVDIAKGEGAIQGDDFERYIIGRYGKTLYEQFFKQYTEKFVGLPCSRISKDWAETGVERAVIDNRAGISSVRSLAKSLFFPRPPLKFIYPKSGGIIRFCEIMRHKVEALGASVALSAPVDKIESRGRAGQIVHVNGNSYPCDLLVWTGPLPELLALLGYNGGKLEYLSLLLYNYRVSHPPRTSYQWCYYGSREIPFNRASIPALFNPALVPAGRTGICAEVTARSDDSLWKNPETLEPAIRKWLALTGMIAADSEIIDVRFEKIRNAYPIYAYEYGSAVRQAIELIEQNHAVKLLGRTGTFWYNNMDHSIQAALQLSRKIGEEP